MVSGHVSKRSTSSSNVEAVWSIFETVWSNVGAVWLNVGAGWSVGEAIIVLSETSEVAGLFESKVGESSSKSRKDRGECSSDISLMNSEDVWQVRDGLKAGGMSFGFCIETLRVVVARPLLGVPRLARRSASGFSMLRLGTSPCDAELLENEFGNSEAALPRTLFGDGDTCRPTDVFARNLALVVLWESSRYEISSVEGV